MGTFKVGDRVKITRVANKEEMGVIAWNPRMTDFVGLSEKITEVTRDGMYYIIIKGYGFKYPGCVLEHNEEPTIQIMEPAELYTHLQEQTGFQTGDLVRVIGTATDYQFGWGSTWDSEIDEYEEETAEITSIDGTYGISIEFLIDDDKEEYSVPFFVLEKVDADEPLTMKLTEDYDADITVEGISVGCQFIDYEKFDKLVALVNRVREK